MFFRSRHWLSAREGAALDQQQDAEKSRSVSAVIMLRMRSKTSSRAVPLDASAMLLQIQAVKNLAVFHLLVFVPFIHE